MKRRDRLFAILSGLLTITIASAPSENWPGWRGPRGDGTSLEANVPIQWTPEKAVWKVALPGRGHASPTVWGERLFTVTAMEETKERVLLCLDRNTGAIVWRQTVVTGPLQKLHRENSYASATPATDGKRVYVVFRVGDDIFVAAHDFVTGEPIWKIQPGTHKGEWGFSNEPVLYNGKVFIDGDSKGDSFLVALNCETGETVWRKDRPNMGISYSAPFIRELAGRVQMIQCGDRRVVSFDPETGQELWEVEGPSQEFVATPVYSEKTGLIYVSSSWPKTIIYAIRPDGRGNVTQTHVVWSDTKGAPYVPSMMAVDKYLITMNRSGVVYCFDAATGDVYWTEKLGRHHASPVLINGRVALINDDGQVNIIKPGAQFERVFQTELGESCYASPAISEGQVFVRGFEHLFCFGKRTP